jgi:Na+/H+ antiporter NhaD/arsenite permease-like protein
VTFFRYLLLPTLINLFIAYLFLRFFYRRYFNHQPVRQEPEPIKDPNLANLSRISLILLIVLVVVKIVLVFMQVEVDFRLTYIALTAAFPLIAFSPKRFSILRKVDWYMLIFFAAMFILMESVWDSGVFQRFINGTNLNLTSTAVVMAVSIILSQFISNVPLVALYLPMLMQMGVSTRELMALAAGSTIAGNLSILGAASNVIIIQNAEQKSGQTLNFLEFVRIGIPLALVNILVYWLFFTVL